MDLNELLYQHQLALMRAGQFGPANLSTGHFDMVKHYAKRIREYRKTNGLTQYSG